MTSKFSLDHTLLMRNQDGSFSPPDYQSLEVGMKLAQSCGIDYTFNPMEFKAVTDFLIDENTGVYLIELDDEHLYSTIDFQREYDRLKDIELRSIADIKDDKTRQEIIDLRDLTSVNLNNPVDHIENQHIENEELEERTM